MFFINCCGKRYTSSDNDALQAFRQDVEGSRDSKHQCDVAHVLSTLGVDHALNHITTDGLFCTDILVKGHHILIQVDGPPHWTTNTGQPIGKACCSGSQSKYSVCLTVHAKPIAGFRWNQNQHLFVALFAGRIWMGLWHCKASYSASVRFLVCRANSLQRQVAGGSWMDSAQCPILPLVAMPRPTGASASIHSSAVAGICGGGPL